jgi:putative zinc finger protein
VHPFGDLSAYLDSALSSEARASVQAHLDTCALCRTRLAELRGTARLIAGLPMPMPSRSLVPRVSVPVWLAPLRTFSTFASGAAIFLFLASAVLSSFPRAMGTGAGAPAAPAANTVSAPQATSGAAADSSSGSPAKFQVAPPSNLPSPAPSTAVSPSLNERSAQGRSDAPTGTPTEIGRQGAAASPSAAEDLRARVNRVEQATSPFVFSPWLWLVVAVAFGALSILLGRRLRSA